MRQVALMHGQPALLSVSSVVVSLLQNSKDKDFVLLNVLIFTMALMIAKKGLDKTFGVNYI